MSEPSPKCEKCGALIDSGHRLCWTCGKRRTAPFTKFGETRELPVRLFRGPYEVTGDLSWDRDLWVERGEDMYALSAYPKGSITRVVYRRDWLASAATEQRKRGE